MEEVSYEARKRNLKQAMVRIIEMDVVIELFWGDPMYHEALEDLKRDKERSRRDEKTKSHKKFLLALLRSAGKVRDTLTAIKGRRGSRRLYREACEEIAESRRTTGGYGVEFKEEFWEFDAGEGAIIMKMDEEEEMSRKIREKARYKGKDGDKPEWETTTDEEEEFQVNRDVEWEGEDKDELKRRKRFRRIKARQEGKHVPKREDDYEGKWW